ncbi:MAG TPA: phosphatase PAP2 family protein [Planctomycetota bacterium]|nr:phosphatase PAP2 family protein [Planctomycetota bacterium]
MILFSFPSHAVLTRAGQDLVMTMMSALRTAAGVLSLLGGGEDAPLPRSIADDYWEAEPPPPEEQQDDPSQDPNRPKKDDLKPRTADEPLLELPHDSIGGYFRTHFAEKAWKENVWDGYLTQPAVLVPLGLAVGAGAVSHWDKPLSSRIRGTMGNNQAIGNISMAALLAGSVALGVLLPGEGRNGWDNFWEEAEVLAVTGVLTTSLKFLVGRTRPGGGMRSFPSGHAATAFAAASLIDDNSGGAFGVGAYGLAGLTGYSRIESGKHFPSDVLVGAAIGILSAQVLDALHWGNGRDAHGIAGGMRLELEPLDRGAMVGFSFKY